MYFVTVSLRPRLSPPRPCITIVGRGSDETFPVDTLTGIPVRASAGEPRLERATAAEADSCFVFRHQSQVHLRVVDHQKVPALPPTQLQLRVACLRVVWCASSMMYGAPSVGSSLEASHDTIARGPPGTTQSQCMKPYHANELHESPGGMPRQRLAAQGYNTYRDSPTLCTVKAVHHCSVAPVSEAGPGTETPEGRSADSCPSRVGRYVTRRHGSANAAEQASLAFRGATPPPGGALHFA